MVKEVEKLKPQGEKVKIQDGVSIEDVQAWGADIEGEIDEAGVDILRLNQYVQGAEAKFENEKCKREKIWLQEQRQEELNRLAWVQLWIKQQTWNLSQGQ